MSRTKSHGATAVRGARALSTRGRSDLAIATPADQIPRRAALARVQQKARTIAHPKPGPTRSRDDQVLFDAIQLPIYGDHIGGFYED